jgi:hypothetical protein
MKCKNHEEKEAAYICRQCNQPICGDCRLIINGENICKNCVEAGYKAGFNKQRGGKLVSLFHFLCSLIPGAGQMQQGAMRRGVQIMLSFIGLGVIAAILHLEEFLFFCAVIWFYSFFDSYHVKRARVLNIEGWDREFIKSEYLEQIISKRESKWVGWILVIIGGTSLLNIFFDFGRKFFGYQLFWTLQNSLIPALALFLGWTILKKSKTLSDIPSVEETEGEIENSPEANENIQS